MEESHYKTQEEYLHAKEMREKGIINTSLRELIEMLKERLRQLKKNKSENKWEIRELEKQIALCEKEESLPVPKADTKKLVGMFRLKEKLQKPPIKALREEMFSTKTDEDEDEEDEKELLDEILLEEKRHTKQLDVLIHLTQLDKIYKSSDKRREYMRKYMRDVREDGKTAKRKK